MIAAGAKNSYAAVGALNHLNVTPADALDVIVACYKQYRAIRDAGKEVDEAADATNAWLAAHLIHINPATPAPAMTPEQAPPILDDVPRWVREIDL